MKPHPRGLAAALLALACLPLAATAVEPRPPGAPTFVAAHNQPEVLLADPRVTLSFGEEQLMLDGGLQPYIILTKKGTLVAQAQLPVKPLPSKRMTYPAMVATVVSRDSGKTWTRFPLETGVTGPNLEGGSIVLADGTILALDTYVTPGDKPGIGLGQLWRSTDDWKTVEGPIEATFSIPGALFTVLDSWSPLHGLERRLRPDACRPPPAPPHPRAAEWRPADHDLRLARGRQHALELHEDDEENARHAASLDQSGPALGLRFHRRRRPAGRHRGF
jgi:hypothetical protein